MATPPLWARSPERHLTGEAELLGADMCLPGDTVRIAVELKKLVAVDSGIRFAIREGGRRSEPESSRRCGDLECTRPLIRAPARLSEPRRFNARRMAAYGPACCLVIVPGLDWRHRLI